ncbi:hypothetical protein G3578_05400 [Brevibacillus sp. SYP-B805]|uniref:hypothetical protein n=1 Tax=Brevibacillus sp. SYP-B805 TaxID=1578199 RepID=UPI0013ECA96B|nr:hypothetical protein [Brevibacillus sp. SYP-B805]NGQ94615.1 hypothetical protein [Brevibacillus sp. SYP-B805]
MAGRLKKSEYILTYMIIITLACFVGGFFLGAGYMKNRIQAEMAAAAEAEKEQAKKEQLLKEQKLYKEQDFIRFYYNVLVPAQSFKEEHFQTFAALQTASSGERDELLKKMAASAENHLKELEKGSVSPSSPLLVQAKRAYEESLRAYLDGIDQLRSAQNSNALPADQLHSMPQLHSFITGWLQAQSEMYQALALWESAYITKRPIPKEFPGDVTLDKWSSYPFLYRSYLSAAYLAQLKLFDAYDPLDLTARIDALVDAKQAQLLGLKDVEMAVKMLDATDAVRQGDFGQLRAKLYGEIKTPEMPLFDE